jgi:hypothetical protein
MMRLLMHVALMCGAAASVAAAEGSGFRLEAPSGVARPGAVVELRTDPPLGAARGDLLATIAGVGAEVDSIADDRVRVRVPMVSPGAVQVRVTAVGRDGQPHQTAAAQLTIAGAEASDRIWARIIVGIVMLLTLGVTYLATPRTNANVWNHWLFLVYDDSTDSYSVKRLQAVLWFFAVFPIVLYAFVYTQFAAGVGTWITLPQNVLYLLGTSAATAVAADTIERMRQVPIKSAAKQAGWRDLFQEGERFSFPRFQIICWTLVTCAFFLSTYWNRADVDPAALPDIPMEFWLLMGLSSATYVGAKVADTETGAPQVMSAVVTPTRSELILRVRNARLRFDMTPEGWLTITGTAAGAGTETSFALDATNMVTQQIDAHTHRMTVPLNAGGTMKDQLGTSHQLDFSKPIRIHLTNPDGQLSADATATC